MPKTLRASYGSGVLSPELFGRIDLARFQSGLKTCHNFITKPHGPAVNRTGFEFVKEVKYSNKATRLLPFIFSPAQAYVLEFGDLYARIHTEGATVLEAAQSVTGATSADPVQLTIAGHGYANGDEVYVASLPGDFAVLNGRYLRVTNVAANTFDLLDEWGNNVDGSGFAAYTSGGAAARPLEVTTPYLEADLFDLRIAQAADTVTITHPDYAPRELVRVSATSWTINTITYAPGIAAPTGVTATPTGGGGTTYTYVVTALSAGGLEESLQSATASCTNATPLSSANYNTVTGTNVSGAVRYKVYRKDTNTNIYGYMGQTDDLTVGFIDNGSVSPDVTLSPPINQTPFGATGDYPTAVGYFDQRRFFAGTDNAPQTTWGTRPGTSSNLSYTIPAQDDDSLNFTLDAVQMNQIAHIVPLTDLLLLTNTGEWKVVAADNGALTPSNLSARRQGNTGASECIPVVAGNTVLYVNARGAHVSAVRYAMESNAYDSADVSVYAPHLFDNYTITNWTYQRAPMPVVWAVRSDGTLLGFTFQPEQEVQSWHTHGTKDGTFESVCAIPESTNEDMLYVVAVRTVDGATKRYIERMHTRDFTIVEDAFFVDSGLSYDGSATTTITGLWHLEGEDLVALADGDVVSTGLTVTNGSVTLPNSASKVHLGLQITADVETLPLVMQAEALAQGVVKNVNHVYTRIHNSGVFKVGPDEVRLRDLPLRTNEPWGSPIALVSETVDILLDGDWNDTGGVLVRQDRPLPLSLLSMVLDAELGD